MGMIRVCANGPQVTSVHAAVIASLKCRRGLPVALARRKPINLAVYIVLLKIT